MPVISHLEAIRSRRAGGQQVIATWRAWLAAMPGRNAAAAWAGVQSAEQVERSNENFSGRRGGKSRATALTPGKPAERKATDPVARRFDRGWTTALPDRYRDLGV